MVTVTEAHALDNHVMILLMAEILHELIGSFSHYLQCFTTIVVKSHSLHPSALRF